MSIFTRAKAALDVLRGKPIKVRAMSMGGGSGSRATRFYGQKYEGGLSSPTLILDSAGARQQVRTLSHNSLQLRALLERDVDTVIAQGLNLSPEPKYQILGIDPAAAEEWGNDVKTRFELWAMSPRASRSAKYNFFQAQRLMRKSLYRDGELFVALSYHNDPTLLSPLRFELLDPDQIRENGYTWTANGAGLNAQNKEGIIRNADGEETAYKVWAKDAQGIKKMTEIPRVGRNGRIMMLHALTGVDYAGQSRGISPLSVCVQDLENILDFTLAQIEKAKNQSNIWATVESDTDEPADDPFKTLTDGAGAGPAKIALKKAIEQYSADPKPDPDAQNVTEESLEPVIDEVPHTVIGRIGALLVASLKGKQKLKPFADTAPSQNFDTFVKAYFSYIAAAMGQSVETVLMLFNNNYSASRATLILTWRIAEQRRWEMDYYVLGPIYEMWLAEEIAAGRINAPGWQDPRLRAAWIAHRYNGLSMPNIDPVKTANAAKEYLSMGATTLGDVAIEHNDSDAQSNRIKLKQELEELREIGPMPWGTGKTGNTAENKNSDKEEEDNAE